MMKMNAEKDEKICRKCKRILVDESKLGICPDCLNKFGSGAALVGGIIGISSLSALVKIAWKNSGKIAKGAVDVIKLIKG